MSSKPFDEQSRHICPGGVQPRKLGCQTEATVADLPGSYRFFFFFFNNVFINLLSLWGHRVALESLLQREVRLWAESLQPSSLQGSDSIKELIGPEANSHAGTNPRVGAWWSETFPCLAGNDRIFHLQLRRAAESVSAERALKDDSRVERNLDEMSWERCFCFPLNFCPASLDSIVHYSSLSPWHLFKEGKFSKTRAFI